MSRSGYSEDCENLGLWRGAVERAIQGDWPRDIRNLRHPPTQRHLLELRPARDRLCRWRPAGRIPAPRARLGRRRLVSGTVVSATTLSKAADDYCPWCKQRVDPDTAAPWWMDHANLAELHRYLTGSDCPEGDALDPASVQYFLEKPWKWTQEWERMRKAQS